MKVTISPARRKMVEVMTLKGLSPVTQDNSQRTVSVLSRDCGRTPQNLSADEISAWVIAWIDEGGQAIMTFRALILSGRFGRAWNALAANDNAKPTCQVFAA